MGGATRFLLLSAPLLLHNHHHRRRFPPLLRLARRYRSPHPLSPSPHHHHHNQPLALSPTPPPHHRDHHHHHHSTFPTKASHQQFHSQTTAGVYPTSPPSHLWPEWSNFIENLYTGGYFNRQGIGGEDEFAAVGDLSDEFLRAASACLAFARDCPNLLGLLSRRDIEAVVDNATPFLFKHGDVSVRRMRSFLISADCNVLDTDNAQTVDLMRFLLSYSSSHIFPSERDNLNNRELVESSVKSLLSELAKLSYSAPEANPSKVVQSQFPDRYGQTPRPVGQNIEMKRGDWICPRCSFMNFARNVKCLECEETRPKRQLTGGEWECPQCDFFNYGRNTACLRCDCKRPGDFSLGTANGRSSFRYSNGGHADKVDVDSRLAASEEKAQRWFTKVSQLDGTSDMSSAIADEDFPEIMPLRKGVNRFVVSTRKTPLERRLTNAQNRRNLGNVGTPEDNDLLTEHANKNLDTKSSRSLDEILGRTSESNDGSFTAGQNAGTESPPISSSSSQQYGQPRGSNSNYVPFVPLPADMFDKKPEDSKMNETEKEVADIYKSDVPNASQQAGAGDKDNNKEEAEKSDRWFKKVAELHDVTDLASAISDEDFPEIMPMRKGENRFVVSKKKDRSLTSPVYKRRMAMEQAGNTNFVPFVPFPPDYFAKKDQQQPNGADLSSSAAVNETSTVSAKPEKPEVNQQDNTRSLNSKPSGQNLYENKTGSVFGAPTGGTTQNIINTQSDGKDSYSIGNSWQENKKEMATSENLNIRASWSGKSLEGSAVKEPDPLDMSEEAKAERWFRRAAQIKDISELSQIPDEDFPSIMPMRKGVNRFVVSKRKTPLERRLTSSQYRRNLPIVTSDPVERESDGS